MRILLTGANGFIGSYVLKYLLERGQQVNILVRNASKKIYRNDFNLKIFYGDINNPEAVNEAITGCDIVIHLAALVRSTANDPSEFYNTNVRGTENLLNTALRNGIQRFIFTSSLAAHDLINGSVISEEFLIKPNNYFSKYAESKARAEELVIENSKFGLSHIIIYPCRVFGIGPLTDANGATKAIYLYLKNKLPFLIDQGEQYSSWSFVEDVARGIVMATNSNISNQNYILGGENKTLADVYSTVDSISSKKHLRIYLKNTTALSLASTLELLAKILGKHPIITRDWLNFVLESRKVSSQKAIKDLNYKITPIEIALEKTIRWLQTL